MRRTIPKLSKDTIQRQYEYRLQRVCTNKGTVRSDDVTVKEPDGYIRANQEGLGKQTRQRKYQTACEEGRETRDRRRGRKPVIPTAMNSVVQRGVVQAQASCLS